jgi:serralysin
VIRGFFVTGGTVGAYEILIDGTPTNGANPWIDSLVMGGAWADSNGGPVSITYFPMFGYDPAGFVSYGYEWFSNELRAMEKAMDAWEAVANVRFEDPGGELANIWYWSVDSLDLDSLGFHEVPGFTNDLVLYGLFNWEGEGWNSQGLRPGGVGFVTLLHELGHGLGLAHPHDGGIADDATVFPGVSSEFGDYGNQNLNQGIFTTMTYNDGWQTQFPGHANLNYGLQATPMALDIAAIQEIYGANTTYNSGSNTYLLPKANGSGTYWSCIWDTGGTDTISAGSTSAGCTINLNAAPLTGANAGGYVSWIKNIVGGVTIANGVVIENATGGSGADRIVGNNATNIVNGGAGNDTIDGGSGADKVSGGNGNDIIAWGSGDAINGGTGTDNLKMTSSSLNLVPLSRKVLEVEQIDLRGGVKGTLTLNRADVLEMSSDTNNIRIFGDSGEKVDIVGSFTRGSVSAGFRTYNLGGGALLTIETDVQVI